MQPSNYQENDSFFLPPWQVKRTSAVGYLTRELKFRDEKGKEWIYPEGREINVLSFNQGGVDPRTGQIHPERVFCCIYIPHTDDPTARPLYINADMVFFKEIPTRTNTYTDVNALDFFHRVVNHEINDTKIFTLSELMNS